METLKLDARNDYESTVRIASEILAGGGIVAVPTETVYGLAASAFSDDAIKAVFTAKGRPQDNPLIVHISDLDTDRNTNLRKVYKIGDKMSVVINSVDADNERISLRPASSIEQDKTTAKYLDNQNDSDGETYNPFAALLKK